ncbi:hypothetical protein B484DRAFT_405982, partial [Ochromonadaceae sp. CCMP2298]
SLLDTLLAKRNAPTPLAPALARVSPPTPPPAPTATPTPTPGDPHGALPAFLTAHPEHSEAILSILKSSSAKKAAPSQAQTTHTASPARVASPSLTPSVTSGKASTGLPASTRSALASTHSALSRPSPISSPTPSPAPTSPVPVATPVLTAAPAPAAAAPAAAVFAAATAAAITAATAATTAAASTAAAAAATAAQTHHKELLSALRGAVKEEAKRVLDVGLKDMVPQSASRIKDMAHASFGEIVKECVKTLPVAFRQCFETTLLPALEAAAGEMVAQLSDALADAAEGGRVAAAETAKANEDLRVEVGVLQRGVAGLEGVVKGLVGAAQANERLTQGLQEALRGMQQLQASQQQVVQAQQQQYQQWAQMQQQMQMQMHQQPQQAPEPVEDAFTLLSQGRISDAVVRVLEDKDIAGTVALLELLTPQQCHYHSH